jgi:hypothetical protein
MDRHSLYIVRRPRHAKWVLALCVFSWLSLYTRSLILTPTISAPKRQCSLAVHAQPLVWVEDAEEGFVDEDENLESGEICLKSVKAFASSSAADSTISIRETNKDDNQRFLCAGALVQRPTAADDPFSPVICDAWMADAILNEGGPNLQFQGALQVLDELFLFHLERYYGNSSGSAQNTGSNQSRAVEALRTFVLHSGESVENEWACASFMASQARGFVPLKDVVRTSSIYSSHFFENDLDGLVFDPIKGTELYQRATSDTTKQILRLLPSKDTLQRYTTKRFTISSEDE